MLPAGALLAQVGGRSSCHYVMGDLLASIQVRLQEIVVHVRSMEQGELFWCILLVRTRHLETCRPMIYELRGDS